eukprot:Nitzschia sp. Nitz4//scaffold3_size479765//390230//391570//NITZ4_000167-RA/size479765-processed-gene-1.328-mRNA-1//-1//CDS//3329550959//804//frame0
MEGVAQRRRGRRSTPTINLQQHVTFASTMSKTNVVIVEAHHHCLEHIHHVIRKKKQFESWSMIHFDAHPDLACPLVPAQMCFRPRVPSTDNDTDAPQTLYDMLDTSISGISQWILPLVLAARLESILWIKPSGSNQMPAGKHTFHVGVVDPSAPQAGSIETFLDLSAEATVKVDWCHSYYWDDDSVADTAEMVLAVSLTLGVGELPLQNDSLGSTTLDELPLCDPWILDICLDYFACFNPYLTDVDNVNPRITKALLNVMKQASSFVNPSDNQPLDAIYLVQLQHFQSSLSAVLETTKAGIIPSNEMLVATFPSEPEIHDLIQDLAALLVQEKEAVQPVLEAIPCWGMPHGETSLSLHSTLSQHKQAVRMLQEMEQTLLDIAAERPPPFLITMARSAEDGFTPSLLVEELQSEVLAMLQRVYNGHSHGTLQVTKDYGEWEGSQIEL